MPSLKKNAKGGGMDRTFNKLLKEIGDPVDFELPDWLRESKFTPYTFIKRNVYVTKKIKRRLKDDGIFCPCTSSAGSSGVCGKDCLCGVLQSSCSSNCKCGSSCLNKPFHQRPAKKLKIVKTEKCGSGIVADEDIKQGDFVIEYVGEVIDDKTCEERLWRMKHRGETNFYLCEINRDTVIDATYKGNKSRYINHSCCPNTEMQKWSVDGETRIGIFAIRDIKKGEYLTYDYQFVQFGADQDCHCGATMCRRKLGVKPSKLKTPASASTSTMKIVARELADASPKLEAVFSRKEFPETKKMKKQKSSKGGVSKTLCEYSTPLFKTVHQGGGPSGISRRASAKRCPRNCIGKIVTIKRSHNKRFFGLVKRFDSSSKRHLIMFEDGCHEFLDMSKESWEFC